MSPKREIRASEIVGDIRSGMNNLDLMEKYRITSEGLRSLFRKLIEAKLMPEQELRPRMPRPEDKIVHGQIRQTQRYYPENSIPVFDLEALHEEYFVRDVSEKGFQIGGIKAAFGDKKTFLIEALVYDDIYPFTFEAECRWTSAEKLDSGETVQVAGFEITNIADEELAELKKLVEIVSSGEKRATR